MTGFFDFTQAIVRKPGLSVISGLREGDGADPDYVSLCKEHDDYVAALRHAGVSVDVLEAAEPYPDSVFVEDAALVFETGALLLRPGASSRAGEAALLLPALKRHFETVLTMDEGHVDGGDILATPNAVVIGLSHRTDRKGAELLAILLARLGKKAVIEQTPASILHFKTGCGMIDEETVLAVPEMAGCGAFNSLRVLVTPEGEEGAANVLRVGSNVLIGQHWAKTRDMIERLGIETLALPVTEIAKLDAGLSCMSLRWQGR
ncbi:dimethylarginine dimethylaminohydrolase family protein [Aquisediminimonas profunda]|uniref:dimethylarginine dimethylaminohydrolase family protein n=1 Tax=Aquisediminimonas profunda TaxID=1550733 RepID=UPI001C634FC0|nr:arginine deiminase family protein [Aquisediminimonas profunda]